MHGGNILLGGIGAWLFFNGCKNRDQRKCAMIAVAVGGVLYVLLVLLPESIFQMQFEIAQGRPLDKVEKLSETFVGRWTLFGSFFGTGISLLAAGLATRFLPVTPMNTVKGERDRRGQDASAELPTTVTWIVSSTGPKATPQAVRRHR